MKKLITLLTIVAVAIGCALTSLDCDAKTKKKRAATRKTTAVSRAKTPTSAGLTIDDFCYYDRENGFGRVIAQRETEDALSRFRNKGFSVSHRTETREDYTGLETYEADIYTFTKTTDAGTTTIVWDSDPITIEFPTVQDAQTFINGVKSFGYRHDSTGWHDPSKCYYRGTDIEVDGTTVKINIRWEP